MKERKHGSSGSLTKWIYHNCKNAIDLNKETTWIANGETTGAWLEITFNQPMFVTHLMYKHPPHQFNSIQKFKEISIEFSDGMITNVTLNDNDKEYMYFNLGETKMTRSIKIKSLSIYPLKRTYHQKSKTALGISELRIFGCDYSG